jgi:hypothetical protein
MRCATRGDEVIVWWAVELRHSCRSPIMSALLPRSRQLTGIAAWYVPTRRRSCLSASAYAEPCLPPAPLRATASTRRGARALTVRVSLYTNANIRCAPSYAARLKADAHHVSVRPNIFYWKCVRASIFYPDARGIPHISTQLRCPLSRTQHALRLMPIILPSGPIVSIRGVMDPACMLHVHQYRLPQDMLNPTGSNTAALV